MRHLYGYLHAPVNPMSSSCWLNPSIYTIIIYKICCNDSYHHIYIYNHHHSVTSIVISINLTSWRTTIGNFMGFSMYTSNVNAIHGDHDVLEQWSAGVANSSTFGLRKWGRNQQTIPCNFRSRSFCLPSGYLLHNHGIDGP